MRCMTAIWPAGPPKLRLATRSQVWKASRSDTPCSSSERCGPATERSAMPGLLHRCRGGPVVGLRLQLAAPGVERVVHHHAVTEHLVIVGKVRGQPQRDGEQAAALRGQVVARGVGAAHDRGEMVERGILDAVDAQDGVERAALAFMRKLDALDIVGCPAGLSGDVENIL